MGRLVVLLGLLAVSGCDGGQGGEVSCNRSFTATTLAYEERREIPGTSGALTVAQLPAMRETTLRWDDGATTHLTIWIEPGGDGTPDVALEEYGCARWLRIPSWLTLETADGLLAVRLPSAIDTYDDQRHVIAVVPVGELVAASGDPVVPSPARSTAVIDVGYERGMVRGWIALSDSVGSPRPVVGSDALTLASW